MGWSMQKQPVSLHTKQIGFTITESWGDKMAFCILFTFFFATGRLIVLLFWQLGRLRTIKKKALLDFLRWLARQKTHKTLSFYWRWKQFCFFSSQEKSLLWLPTKLDLVQGFEYNVEVWWTLQNMSHNANLQCPKKKRLHRSLSGWKKAQWVRVCVSVCV